MLKQGIMRQIKNKTTNQPTIKQQQQQKNPPKILLSSFCVDHFLLGMGPGFKSSLCTL